MKAIMKTIKAWHFVGKTLRDGSPIPRNGKKLRYDNPLLICSSGFHASKIPYDALQYAPGNTLCLVECGGEFIHQNDKFCCSERTIIARMDATELCRYFARQAALSVIEHYPNGTDDVVFDFLMTGEHAIAAHAAKAAYAAADAAHAAAYAYSAAANAASYAANDFNQLVYETFGEIYER